MKKSFLSFFALMLCILCATSAFAAPIEGLFSGKRGETYVEVYLNSECNKSRQYKLKALQILQRL